MNANHPSPPRTFAHRHRVPWRCPDPECQQPWSDVPERWPCQVGHCDVACCEDCRTVCECCGKTACSAHRKQVDEGEGADGGRHVWCADCVAEFEAEEAAELAREESPAITWPEGVLCPF